MMRSMASMPPLAGSRSSRTAPGWCSTTAASASSGGADLGGDDEAGRRQQAAQRAGPGPAVADHDDDQRRRGLAGAGHGRAEVLSGHRHRRRPPPSPARRAGRERGALVLGIVSPAPALEACRPCEDRRGHALVPAARPGPGLVRRARPRPALARARHVGRGRCWSARSCCSRPRSPGCCRSTGRGWTAGRRRPPWPPSRRARRCGPGAGSATRAGRCGCTRRRPRWSQRHGGELPDVVRRAARAARRRRATPPRPSRRSRTAPGTPCWTPTCAGCSPGRSAAPSSRRRTLTRRPSGPAPSGCVPDEPATAARWAVAVMELGALVCTARAPRCDRLPGRRPVRVAAGRPPGVRRAGAAHPGASPGPTGRSAGC